MNDIREHWKALLRPKTSNLPSEQRHVADLSKTALCDKCLDVFLLRDLVVLKDLQNLP